MVHLLEKDERTISMFQFDTFDTAGDFTFPSNIAALLFFNFYQDLFKRTLIYYKLFYTMKNQSIPQSSNVGLKSDATMKGVGVIIGSNITFSI